MILTGVSEIGEGILTVLTQIAADELGNVSGGYYDWR